MWLARRVLATAVLLYIVLALNENNFYLNGFFDLLQLTASSAFEVFKIEVMLK